MAALNVNMLLRIGTVLASAGAVAFVTMAVLSPHRGHVVVLSATTENTWFPRRVARADAEAETYRSGGFDATLAVLLARSIDGSAPEHEQPIPNVAAD